LCTRPAGWGTPHPGEGRCKLHGGSTPTGIASVYLKSGRYSRDLPTRLLSTYQEALADPNAPDLADEIALMDARLRDLLARVDTGESGRLWRDARSTFEVFKKAIRDGDGERQREAIGQLDRLLGRGASDFAAWDEIGRLVDRRQRLTDSQVKRLLDAERLIRVDQATALMLALLDSVRRNVDDHRQLSAIQADFARITEGSGARPTRPDQD
jgi:hypothetical protein